MASADTQKIARGRNTRGRSVVSGRQRCQAASAAVSTPVKAKVPDQPKLPGSSASATNPDPDVGPPLFTPAAPVKVEGRKSDGGLDQIVMANCTVQNEERQQAQPGVGENTDDGGA